MAVDRVTYKYDASVTANSVVTVATIETPVTIGSSSSAKPLGLRIKLDITSSAAGVSAALSGELFLAIGYYYDSGTDSIVMDITPEGKVLEEYGIVDVVDLASWFHLIYPDLSSWFDYVKVLISATSPDGGQTAIFYIDVNSPNVNTKILAETITWQLI